ncbi:MAG: murein biosynthesis integral membrane protein MurJ [Actinobacteria bacterium]|nr:murein biosynthesis integral membrane protein MurJ [Actinomycetota bacterium]
MTENQSHGPSVTNAGLLSSSAVMAAGTVASRVTGVMRDIAMTAALGFYLVSDAFSLGNTLPNIIYILVIGGALNAIFIPQLVRRMKDDADNGRAYADRLLTITFLSLLVLSVAAVLLAPWIVDLYSTAQYGSDQRELATAFARLCLPQIFFYGAFALLSQVLNSRGKFGAPMFAPIIANVIAIATFVTFIVIAGTTAAADGQLSSDQVLLLGLGTTIGVALQALVLIPVLWKAGYVWRPRFDWRGHGLGKAGTLAIWTLGLVVVNQAGYVVITRLATLANVSATDAGTVAAGLTTYQKANLIFMLPQSVITISIVTAMLPSLSRIAHSGQMEQVGRDITSTMRLVASFIVPIGVILMVIGPGIAVLLFGYGAATTAQAALMGSIVSVFMVGLLPFSLWYVVLRGFYALEDTKTPFWISVAFNVATLVVAIPLFYSTTGGVQIAMLALGYVVGFWVAFVLAWFLLARKLRKLGAGWKALSIGSTVRSLLRMVLAGTIALLIMAIAQYLLINFLFGNATHFAVLINVIVVVAVGSGTYLLLARMLRITEVSESLALVTGRIRRLRRKPVAS